MELSTYFRINAANTGQFERTLIVAEEGAYVSYLEGCTAPMRDENQLHAAVVELVALDERRRSSTRRCRTGIPATRTARAASTTSSPSAAPAAGARSQDLLDPGRDRLGHHLEVPELHPAGRRLGRRVLLGGAHQQLPAGRHRHEDDPHRQEHEEHDRLEGHLGRPRPEHLPRPGARSCKGATAPATTRSATRCCSATSAARTPSPTSRCSNTTAQVEHEASTSKIGEDQIFYCQQRGLSPEDAVNMIVNGFCKEVFQELPMEFAVEAQKLLRRFAWKGVGGTEMGRLSAARNQGPPRPVGGNEILRGVDLTVNAGRGPRASWARTAPARARSRTCSPAATATRSPRARCSTRARTCSRWRPRSGRARASSWPSSTRSRSPASRNIYFLKAAVNAVRKHRGLPEFDAMEFLALVKEKAKLVEIDEDARQAAGQRGLLGRREEAQRDLPDGDARAAARHPRRDRLRASTSTRCASWPTASTTLRSPERGP